MTSVPHPTQPPAAPETDVRLTEAECAALAGALGIMVRPNGYLAVAVERIVAERVRVVEGERDRLRRWKDEALPVIDGLQDLGDALGLPLGQRITGPAAVEAARNLTARAESAEAAHRALQAERDEAWRVAAQRRNEARRYYVAWQVARMRARVWRRAAGGAR